MSRLLNGFNNGRDNSDGVGGQKPIDRDFEDYLKRIKSLLYCNATKEIKEENVTYIYNDEEIDKHIKYFEDCFKENLSPNRSLLYFEYYLNEN